MMIDGETASHAEKVARLLDCRNFEFSESQVPRNKAGAIYCALFIVSWAMNCVIAKLPIGVLISYSP
jgi:hypothetical protein